MKDTTPQKLPTTRSELDELLRKVWETPAVVNPIVMTDEMAVRLGLLTRGDADEIAGRTSKEDK